MKQVLSLSLGLSLLLSCQSVDRSEPFVEEGFANPELLVTTEWLEEHLSSEDLRIVDARPKTDYDESHIPGAVSVPRSDTFDPNGERSIVGSAEHISSLFGTVGIDETHQVVVYDGGRATAAARVLWTLEHYGHPHVSVLDGGMNKWSMESRPQSVAVPDPSARVFRAMSERESRSTRESVLADIGDASVVMLDARGLDEFTGERVLSSRGGHIPGAVHLEWTDNFTDDDTPVLKSPFVLASMYERAGVTRDKRVHAY